MQIGLSEETNARLRYIEESEISSLHSIHKRADWAQQDPGITHMLEANGRAGGPLYLFYPKSGPAGARRQPIVLPQILTAKAILHEIQPNRLLAKAPHVRKIPLAEATQ